MTDNLTDRGPNRKRWELIPGQPGRVVYDDALRQKLAEEYKELIGYDPFEDDPTISNEEVEQTLKEYKEALASGEEF